MDCMEVVGSLRGYVRVTSICSLGLGHCICFLSFPCGSVVKNSLDDAGDARDVGLTPVSGRSPGDGRGNQRTPVFLPRTSHGQRSLAGYSLWGHKELDTAEHTHTHTHTQTHTPAFPGIMFSLPQCACMFLIY